LLQHSNLRITDAYILSEFHPTCLSNEPAPAIKTDYSALRIGEKERHMVTLTQNQICTEQWIPGSSLRTHLSSRRGTRRSRIWQVRGGSIEIATEIIPWIASSRYCIT